MLRDRQTASRRSSLGCCSLVRLDFPSLDRSYILTYKKTLPERATVTVTVSSMKSGLMSIVSGESARPHRTGVETTTHQPIICWLQVDLPAAEAGGRWICRRQTDLPAADG